jgi:hypothetical protein
MSSHRGLLLKAILYKQNLQELYGTNFAKKLEAVGLNGMRVKWRVDDNSKDVETHFRRYSTNVLLIIH